MAADSSTYQIADTDNGILRKILLQYGGQPMPGDTDNQLLRKILELLNLFGSPLVGTEYQAGDLTHAILRKILARIRADAIFLGAQDDLTLAPQFADMDTTLLRKIIAWINLGSDAVSDGTAPAPGDSQNNLLRRYLMRLQLGGVII